MEKVKVDQEKCIGCGACTAIASEVFSFDDEERVVKTEEDNNILDNMSEELKNDVLDALDGCPTSAIYKENV